MPPRALEVSATLATRESEAEGLSGSVLSNIDGLADWQAPTFVCGVLRMLECFAEDIPSRVRRD